MGRIFSAVAILVIALVFAGCTQYDYSLLWWQMNQKENAAQNQAVNDVKGANIPALFAATFEPNADNVSISYSADGVTYASLSPRAATAATLYAKAVYSAFPVANGTVSGTMIYTFAATVDAGVYTVSSYTAEVANGGSLWLTVGGRSHAVDVVGRGTATGTVKEGADGWTSNVSVEVPDAVTISTGGETVVGGEEESGCGEYRELFDAFLAYTTAASLSGVMQVIIEPEVENPVPGVDYSYPITNSDDEEYGYLMLQYDAETEDFYVDRKEYRAPDGAEEGVVISSDSISFTGSLTYYQDENLNMKYVFNDFKIVDVFEVPSEDLLVGLDGTIAINGEPSPTSSSLIDIEADITIDGVHYDGSDFTLAYLMMNIFSLVVSDEMYTESSGHITFETGTSSVPVVDYDYDFSGADIEGTNGSVTMNGKTYYFEFSATKQIDDLAEYYTFDDFAFGDNRNSLDKLNVELLNMIVV